LRTALRARTSLAARSHASCMFENLRGCSRQLTLHVNTPLRSVRRHGRAMKRLLLAGLLTALLSPLPGCKRQPYEGAPEIRKAYIGPELGTTAATLSPEEADRRACEARMRVVLQQPEVPGAPAIESQRAVLLARTKAEPVFFKERPEYD